MSSNVDKKTIEGEEPVRLCNYVDVYYSDRITSELDFMEATATDAEIARFLLRAGDVIITKDSESSDDIAVPTYVVQDFDDVLCGYHLAMIRSRPGMMDGRYLFYCFAADGINYQFRISANGITRFGLSLGALGGALFPVPPLPDQLAIADFLDEKTAAIDALIARKERLIELIEEKRQATITRAVTKGLDPDVPLKDSGVEWLGEVPAHWQVVHLRRAIADSTYGISESLELEGAIPVLRMGNIRNGMVSYDDLKYVEQVDPALVLQQDDLLFNRTNSLDLVGRVAIYSGEQARKVSFASYLVRLRANERARPRYLNYLLNTPAVLRIARAMALPAVGQANLNPSRYAELLICLPPVEEQLRIVELLDLHDERSAVVLVRIAEQISKLREYRQTLISAAVTGQLDLSTRTARAWASAVEPIIDQPEEVLA